MIRLSFLFAALCASTTAAQAGSHSITSCASPFDVDVAAIYWNIDDRWADFESFVESYSGYDIGSCLEEKLTDNGDTDCDDLPAGVAGRANPWGQQINLDDGYLSDLEDNASSRPDRRACIAALMVHEHSHNCAAGEGKADNLGEAAYAWWQDVFGGTDNYVDLCSFSD